MATESCDKDDEVPRLKLMEPRISGLRKWCHESE